MVELKDKMQDLPASAAAPVAASAAADDIVSALVHLGYSRPRPSARSSARFREHGEGRFEDLLRAALQVVSRR